MIELKLPELGENIESAEVSRLLIAEGDMVQVDQNVLELESDKASFPLPSTHAGRVARIHVKVGDTVAIGQTLLEIEESAAGRGQRQARKAASCSGTVCGRHTNPKRKRGGRRRRRPTQERTRHSVPREKKVREERAPRSGSGQDRGG